MYRICGVGVRKFAWVWVFVFLCGVWRCVGKKVKGWSGSAKRKKACCQVKSWRQSDGAATRMCIGRVTVRFGIVGGMVLINVHYGRPKEKDCMLFFCAGMGTRKLS